MIPLLDIGTIEAAPLLLAAVRSRISIEAISDAIAASPVWDRVRERGLKRLFLHAARFQFEIGERSYAFSAPLAPELAAVLDTLKEEQE